MKGPTILDKWMMIRSMFTLNIGTLGVLFICKQWENMTFMHFAFLLAGAY